MSLKSWWDTVLGKEFLVNTGETCEQYVAGVRSDYAQHKYIRYPEPRFGKQRTLAQNALLHIWVSEIVAHLCCKDKKLVTRYELMDCKRWLKDKCYKDNGWPWLVRRPIHPITGQESGKPELTSSTEWSPGEAYQVLTWVQLFAGFMVVGRPLILESKGEFQKLKETQNGDT